MSENNLIKSIVESTCPHCNEVIYVESQFQPATVGEIFTKEKLIEAKEDCKARIESLSIDDEKKNSVIKWLEDENTIFAPSEVENIILSLLKPQNE